MGPPASLGAAGIGLVWGWYVAGFSRSPSPLRTFAVIVTSIACLGFQTLLFGSLPALVAFGAGLLVASTAHVLFRAVLRARASTILSEESQ